MPAPSPALILDDPPPLTPAALRNFPYRLRAFPLGTLIPFARAQGQAQPEPSAAADAVE